MGKDVRQKSSKSLETLIVEATEHLKALRYSAKTVRRYEEMWKRFNRFVVKRSLPTVFSVDASEQFLASLGVLPISRNVGAHKRHLRMAMRVLTEFNACGFFYRRRFPEKMPLSSRWIAMLEGYERFAREERRTAPRCLRCQMRDVRKFLQFLEGRGLTSPVGIDADTLSVFFRLRAHMKPKTLATTASTLRSFLRYLVVKGMLDSAVIAWVPKIRVYAGERLPTVWTSQDVQSLLATVDRASPLGKRDYAILLLAVRLGMRPGDIRDLRLENLDWEQACIHVVQSKTGTPLELPLPGDVGDALIDYLKHGRPATTRREIFLRTQAPYEPFGPDNNLHSIITTYRRKAGIKLPRLNSGGLHSLRHTLASRLLEAGTPLDTIAGVMGHLSLDTTRLYTRIDVEALRQVALDPEEVLHG